MKRILSVLLVVALLTLPAFAHGHGRGRGGQHGCGRYTTTQQSTVCGTHQGACANATCYAGGTAVCPTHGAGCQGYGCAVNNDGVCTVHGVDCPGPCGLAARS